SIGVALTAAAAPFWIHLSLLDESRRRVEQALAALSVGEIDDPRREMKLLTALGATMIWFRSAVPELGRTLAKALEIAEALDDTEYRLRLLRSQYFFHTHNSQHRAALGVAERFTSLAATRKDRNDQFIGERLMAASSHIMGDHVGARRSLERFLT